MSERNFQRVSTWEIGKSPALYVEEVRLEAVRRKLEPRRDRRGLRLQSRGCYEPIVSVPFQDNTGRVSDPFPHQRRSPSSEAAEPSKAS